MTPWEMEQDALEGLAEMAAKRDALPKGRERKELSSKIKLRRHIAKWARTRAGYAKPKVGPTG